MTSHATQPWYVKSFQEDYLKIYSHRTDEAAREEIKDITAALNMKKDSSVLDLCCGNGRHSRALAALGYRVTGIDLSQILLAEAKKKATFLKIDYICADVRDVPFIESFDYVLNLFTSFGYFDQRAENVKVFKSIHSALKRHGEFLIDFLNPSFVQRHLVPFSEREVEDLRIVETRRIMNRKVIKDIEVYQGKELKDIYKEEINLYGLNEMKQMISESGLVISNVYGDLKLSKFDALSSPRMIITGRKI